MPQVCQEEFVVMVDEGQPAVRPQPAPSVGLTWPSRKAVAAGQH